MSLAEERRKLAETAGVSFDQYVTNEAVEEVSGHLEACSSFLFSIILPIIIFGTVFIALSIGLGYVYGSILFGILFFIISLVISVLGGGALGLKSALKNIITGVNGIIRYSLSVFKDVYYYIKVEKANRTITASEVYRLVSYNIMLPIISGIIRRKLLGFLLYKIIELVLYKVTKSIAAFMDKFTTQKPVKDEIIADKNPDEKVSQVVELIQSVSQKINDYSDTAVKGIRIVTNLVSIFSIILGSVLLLVLWALHGVF